MKEVTADLDIQVNVDCPHCGQFINIMDEHDTNGHAHNEEGDVIKQACPDDCYWTDEHKKFSIENVTCTECQESFNVKGLDW